VPIEGERGETRTGNYSRTSLSLPTERALQEWKVRTARADEGMATPRKRLMVRATDMFVVVVVVCVVIGRALKVWEEEMELEGFVGCCCR
jgi:hypothetical protein